MSKENIFDKLTDPSRYTGSHKQRFDETGKGKGKEGRADVVVADGYVDGFKKTKDSPQRKLSAKESAVVGRLTDPKLYTGSHKNRFDENGKGKGIDGRVDRVENDGYVDGFKKAKAKPTTKSNENPEIFNRLTDPKLYTGSHKHRFDENGKGLGVNQVTDGTNVNLQDIVRSDMRNSPRSKSPRPPAQTEKPAKTTPKKEGGSDIFDRLTDPKLYTGSHKNRFDESGRGKGKEGRAELVSNDGYVNGYKHKDTFDKK